ncbi:hypothetical protein ACHAXT_003428 [Thalassiosira profunda]
MAQGNRRRPSRLQLPRFQPRGEAGGAGAAPGRHHGGRGGGGAAEGFVLPRTIQSRYAKILFSIWGVKLSYKLGDTSTMNEPPTRSPLLPPAPYPPPPAHRGRSAAGSSSGGAGGGSGSGGRGLHSSSQSGMRAGTSSSGDGDPSRNARHQRGHSPSATPPSYSTLEQRESGGAMGSSARSAGRRLPPRAAFVPGAPRSDLYGAINCAPVPFATGCGGDAAIVAGGGGQSKAARPKAGPPLLEVRRMTYAHAQPGAHGEEGDPDEATDGNATQHDDGRSSRNKRPSLVHHETVLVSRVPGVGSGEASSCLAFCPSPSSDAHDALSSNAIVRCATGSTRGTLCVHALSHLFTYGEGGGEGDVPSATVAHFAPRHPRPATSVAWHPGGGGGGLVAVGLADSGGSGGGGAGLSAASITSAGALQSMGAAGLSSASSLVGAAAAASGAGGSGPGTAAAPDEDFFGVLLWDVEAQSAGTAAVQAPAHRLAPNSGVESLAWLPLPSAAPLLAVGCRRRSLHLCDLRVSSPTPPVSVFAHSGAVAGIVPDPASPGTFATFSTAPTEPVKIWDARRMDAPLAEIAVPGAVGAAAWAPGRPGVLALAVGTSIRRYDVRGAGPRALPVGVAYVDDSGGGGGGGDDSEASVRCLAFQPQAFRASAAIANPFERYPHRMLAVASNGRTAVLPEYPAAPLAVSPRDGRIAAGLGRTVRIGPPADGPSAMEGASLLREDVSARMLRRARGFHAAGGATDAADSVSALEEERARLRAEARATRSRRETPRAARAAPSNDFAEAMADTDQLLHCWRWIARVERLSADRRTEEPGGLHGDDLTAWPANGLADSGIWKLLRMSGRDAAEEGSQWTDTKTTSDTLHCDVYDSPLRRAALNACGWTSDLLDEREAQGEVARSAARAAWHGDLDACMAALQRGAEDVRALLAEGSDDGPSGESYAETLGLMAVCVAGFHVTTATDGTKKTTGMWSSACGTLLRRPDLSAAENAAPGLASYLRAILVFLQSIGSGAGGFDRTIYDEGLSLADRVGFACRFLPRTDLRAFLDASVRRCITLGKLEGLLITGLSKLGIGLLQSYVDRTADVQTAALISCRVVLPSEWNNERRICLEWLENYRLLLNNLQMWHSRAAFDVGRFEHLRRLQQGGNVALAPGGRPTASAKKQPQKEKAQASNFPPQLWARCNYCNASLPLSKLRRQEGIANSWLSRQKPVLSCCPQCKKPLPRCSICLLSLGCLNPFTELQRERNQYPRSGSGGGAGGNIQGMEDLSGLASIPFATWFSWCMRCKHGGHAHHLCAWFEKHSTCAVSGCDCQCQFDGIEKLKRPDHIK